MGRSVLERGEFDVPPPWDTEAQDLTRQLEDVVLNERGGQSAPLGYYEPNALTTLAKAFGVSEQRMAQILDIIRTQGSPENATGNDIPGPYPPRRNKWEYPYKQPWSQPGKYYPWDK